MAQPADNAPQVSIVVPNWNGEAFLRRCVAAALQSAQLSGFSYELIVVDDCSSDGAVAKIQADFPQINWVFNETNLGFAQTINHGATLARGKWLVLLNNDLIARERLIAELVRPLTEHDDVFGVAGKTLEWDGCRPNHLNMMGAVEDGRFVLRYEDSPELTDTMFLQGGCCAVRREEFLRLGGFNELFAPGYWEDYDLSYLALKAGWRNLYNPAATALHLGQGSMNRAHGKERIWVVRERNALYFQWLNFTDSGLLSAVLNRLPMRLAHGFVHYGQRECRCFAKGAWQAFFGSKEVAQLRTERMGLIKISDQEILHRFAGRGTPSQ